ncbi:MAG: SMP-30/gluconolactonase/LRE family protein [Bacteroidales bacterium]|nr:SMP-30/gluconolactonase/LRE family protein [Bacteroidales bacterium]
MHKLPGYILFLIPLSGIHAQNSVPSCIAKNAEVQKAGSGYSFTEGSSVARDGRVFFTDQPNDRIYIWDEKEGISLFKEGCERSNGTWFSQDGNLLACADLNNRLVKFTPSGDMIVLHDKGYRGRHLNGPNDLWQDKQGGIYFTDPYYHRDYWKAEHKQEQDIQAVYYLRPTGEMIRVVDDLKQPNGIVGTPDGKFLLVADIQENITWKYAIHPDGSLGNKTRFAPAGSDGMTVDSRGNVYLTFGKVLIFNSLGDQIGDIQVPEMPSNLCFGGKDRKTLFITARTSVYTLRMKIKGAE